MRPALRLGPLAPPHRARVAEIARATGVFSEDEIAVAVELFDEAMHDSVPPDGSPYVVLGAFTPDDELVGFACYGPTPGTDRTWDLYWIAVDPALHGTGGGTLLLSEVERRLQGQAARMLVVETSSRPVYEPTRAFYARRGYAEAARVGAFYAPGDDRVIFTKRFHSPHDGRGAQAR